jgi:hypothetical protein
MTGQCTIQPIFDVKEYKDKDFTVLQCVCQKKQGAICKMNTCLHNNMGDCTRDELYVDKSTINARFICMCFSNKSFSNHMDWSRNLDSTGHAKGGNIPDNEAHKYKRKKQF